MIGLGNRPHHHHTGNAGNRCVIDGIRFLVQRAGQGREFPQALDFGSKNDQLVIRCIIYNADRHCTLPEAIRKCIGNGETIVSEKPADFSEFSQCRIGVKIDLHTVGLRNLLAVGIDVRLAVFAQNVCGAKKAPLA